MALLDIISYAVSPKRTGRYAPSDFKYLRPWQPKPGELRRRAEAIHGSIVPSIWEIPMRAVIRPLAAALSVACAIAFFAALPIGAAFAKDAPPPELPQAPKQIQLTDKQIEGVIAAKPDIDAVIAKLPQDSDKPDPKTIAQLDAIVKKHGFATYDEYSAAAFTVYMVMDGFDPETKKYVGSEAMIKKQIDEVKGDKKMSAKEKKDALKELNEQLKLVAPLQFPGDVQVVSKYYDKLAPLMSQDQQ
jgi:hypothetical protein